MKPDVFNPDVAALTALGLPVWEAQRLAAQLVLTRAALRDGGADG